MSYLVFDVESYAIDKAADYLEPATAPANYKDPLVIATYIEKANAEQLAKAALDVDLARIVCLGIDDGSGPLCATATNEDEERELLIAFWLRLTGPKVRPTLVGFNCLGFDLPLLLRRSLYLDVKAPKLQMGKYRHDGIEDLMLALSFDGALRYRGLGFYARRFGLDVPVDANSGSDVAALVRDGNYDAVAAHGRCDIGTTMALARRMGVI